MKRREFIKKAGIATTAAFAAPYILPSGRLFAQSGARVANHVVFCLFAGGVRNMDTVQMKEGNLMRGMLTGNNAITSDIAGSMSPLPAPPFGTPLQQLGTLFKDAKYAGGPTGHYSGHSTAVTGRYTGTNYDLRSNPDSPTIFEMYRKHNSPSTTALNAWWVSNSLGPYPSLNYSRYPGYGPEFGANFIAPTYLINGNNYDTLAQTLSMTDLQKDLANDMRDFVDGNYSGTLNLQDQGITNTREEREQLEAFLKTMLTKSKTGQFNNPWGVGSSMNGDMYNVFYAEEIIKEFKPELLVVNMQGVDVCHTNYTEYCNNIRKCDWAVSHLWQTIESTPGMQGDTVLIIAPEHGRNANGNSIVDMHGRPALDHTGDASSRSVFIMLVGPGGKIKQNQVITTTAGESVDIVPTIAHILGFGSEIPGGLIKDFDRTDLVQAFA